MYADYQRFGDDFEGLDLAIQTLWLIKASEMFAPMLKGIVKQNVTRSRDALALSLAHEALDTWKTKGLTDKGKCYALRSILVPDALSQSSFRRMIYSSPVETMPPYLTEEHRKKILGKLQQFVVDMEAKNAN